MNLAKPLLSSALAAGLISVPLARAHAQAAPNNKEFEDYDQIEKDHARQEALHKRYDDFRVCADPGNMPLSDKRAEGFENKIADLLAASLGAPSVTYFWRPYIERGVTRQTFDTNSCDVFIDVPFGYEPMLTSEPLYRSTYVLAYRDDRHFVINSLSDPILKDLRIGVYELSAARESLANHGIVKNVSIHEVSYDGDLVESHQPWWQVHQMVEGKIDIAAVWGPIAGWVKTMQHAPITLQPMNRMDDIIPMEFDLAIGVRKTDVVLKYAIDDALEKNRDKIRSILDAYGVPLVDCGECLISGPVKAHGIYTAPMISAAEEAARQPPAVTRAQLDAWLQAGADINQELVDAVLGDDPARIGYLLSKGANPNKPDLDGRPPLATAAEGGSISVMKLLLDHGAQVNQRDADGWTPLLYAAAQNRPEAARLLIRHGASTQTATQQGYTPLSIAVEEGKFDVARVLIDGGAKVDARVSADKLTALMVIASERPAENRAVQLTQSVGPIEIARDLLGHGARVNAADADGVTALMIAAARDNSAMIGLLIQSGAKPDMKSREGKTARQIAVGNDNLEAVRIFDLFAPAKPGVD